MNEQAYTITPELDSVEPCSPRDRENLITEHRTVGIKLAKRLLGQWQMRLCTDELTSLVDLSLCEAAAQFRTDRGAQFSTFLFYYIRGNIVQHIEKNVAIKNLVTQMAARPEVDADIETPEQRVLKCERHAVIQRLFECLDPYDREVVKQLFLQERPRKLVAKNLSTSVATIARIEKHALSQLRSLAKKIFDPEKAKASEKQPALSEMKLSYRRRNRRIHASALHRRGLASVQRLPRRLSRHLTMSESRVASR